MKIEAGKYYRLRNGTKAYVIGRDVNADPDEAWVGSVPFSPGISRMYK